MKDGKMICPVCKGTGTITEDANEYMFVTREPGTNKCLACNGTGRIGPRKIMTDGTPAYKLATVEQQPLKRKGRGKAKPKPFCEGTTGSEEAEAPRHQEVSAIDDMEIMVVVSQGDVDVSIYCNDNTMRAAILLRIAILAMKENKDGTKNKN